MKTKMTSDSPYAVPYSWSLPVTADGKILSVSYEVLMEKGLHGATISEIAQRAGISRPTLYRRFADMNTIVISLVNYLVIDMMNQRYRLVTDVNELITHIINFVVDLRDQPLLLKLVEARSTPFYIYILEQVGATQKELLTVLASLLHHCRAFNPRQLCEEDDLELAAMVIMIMQGVSFTAPTMRELIIDDTWRRHVEYALRGLLCRPKKS